MHRGGGFSASVQGPTGLPSFSLGARPWKPRGSWKPGVKVGSPLGLAAGDYVSLEEIVTGWISERKLRPSVHIGLAVGDSVQMSDPPVQMGKLRPRESKWLFPNHASGGRDQAKSQVLPMVKQYVLTDLKSLGLVVSHPLSHQRSKCYLRWSVGLGR